MKCELAGSRWFQWAAAVALLGSYGCTGYTVPRALDLQETALVDSVERGLTAGVLPAAGSTFGEVVFTEDFLRPVRASGIFAEVKVSWTPDTEPDVFIRPLYKCDLAQDLGGGFVPILPILTFGIVPQLVRGHYHWAFEIERSGQSLSLDCPLRGTFGIGWIPLALRATPGWSKDPQTEPRFYRRLALELAKALETLPRD